MNTYKHPEHQYLALMRDILENGITVMNPRTGSNCKTVLNRQIKFDGNVFPLVTTRKSYWKQAILEMICYMRGMLISKIGIQNTTQIKITQD